MKFKYWHFATLYFMIILIMGIIECNITKSLSPEAFQHDLIVIMGYCGLIDYMNDRMGA